MMRVQVRDLLLLGTDHSKVILLWWFFLFYMMVFKTFLCCWSLMFVFIF